MRKIYQNRKIDTSQPVVLERVSVAFGGADRRGARGLLALAVGTGLRVIAAMMESDVSAVCGPKSAALVRCGHGPSQQTIPPGSTATSISGYYELRSNGMPEAENATANEHNQSRSSR